MSTVARRLMILRHAHAPQTAGQDFDRPISAEGLRAAAALKEKMSAAGLVPDIILCSPAVRTRQTLAALFPGQAALFDEKIYDAAAGDLHALAKAIDDRHHQALLVGHNPGVYNLARFLAAAGGEKLQTGYNPATLSVLEFDGPWQSLAPGCARLVDLMISE